MVALPKKTGARAKDMDQVDSHIGTRLKLRRNLVGMSQDQLGKAVGLTFQQIQKYENGSNRISASRLYQLAQLLNVPISYFYEDMEVVAIATEDTGGGFSDNAQQPLDDSYIADDERLHRRETLKLIRAYYSITEEKQRRKIFELIKSMAE